MCWRVKRKLFWKLIWLTTMWSREFLHFAVWYIAKNVTTHSSHHCVFSTLWICAWPCKLLCPVGYFQSGCRRAWEHWGLPPRRSSKPCISHGKQSLPASWRMRDRMEQRRALLPELPSVQLSCQLSDEPLVKVCVDEKNHPVNPQNCQK